MEQTLHSIRTQDYTNYEVLVCDDCSTDGTFDFLTSLKRDWESLRIFRNEQNLNFNGTLQKLFSLASGEFVAMQHDHDVYKPYFLSRMVELLLSKPNAGFACAAYDVINQQERLIPKPPLPEFTIFKNGILERREFIKILATERYTPIAAMSAVFRRSAIERAGGYSTDWYLASDEDFYRRIAAHSDIAFCPESIFVMRLRPAERQKILGSWKSIYTLFLFRTSIAPLLDSRHANAAIFRQYVFKWKALLREGFSLWLNGESAQLRDALSPPPLPPLPTDRKPMTGFERVVLRLFIWPLLITVRIGVLLNAVRKAIRQ